MSEALEHEPIEGELVPYQPSAPANLFGAADPAAVIERATEVATVLRTVLAKQQLTKAIQGKDHVLVEGWTLLGSMLGVFPVCVWTRPLGDPAKPQGWEARVEARTRAGDVVGAAEAMCTREENLWGWNPTGRNGQKLEVRSDFALRSMAQTRATSKALRQPLGFVVTLAGFDATPAEERVDGSAGASGGAEAPAKASKQQQALIGVKIKELEEKYPKAEGQLTWVQEVRQLIGKNSRADFTKAEATRAIDWLQEQLDGEAIPFG